MNDDEPPFDPLPDASSGDPEPARPSDPSPMPRAKAQLPPAGCAPSLEELYQYMDGALDETRRAQLQSRLNACDDCGELYRVQEQFLKLIGVRCRTELPPELPDRIFGAIAELRGTGATGLGLGLPPKRKP